MGWAGVVINWLAGTKFTQNLNACCDYPSFTNTILHINYGSSSTPLTTLRITPNSIYLFTYWLIHSRSYLGYIIGLLLIFSSPFISKEKGIPVQHPIASPNTNPSSMETRSLNKYPQWVYGIIGKVISLSFWYRKYISSSVLSSSKIPYFLNQSIHPYSLSATGVSISWLILILLIESGSKTLALTLDQGQ